MRPRDSAVNREREHSANREGMYVGSSDVGRVNVLDDCSKRNPLESFSKFETTRLASFELTKILQLRQQTGMPLNDFLEL